MITKLIEQLTAFLWAADITTLELWQISLTQLFAVVLAVVVFVLLFRAVMGIFKGVFKWF